jgi:adenylate kinase family enzyme
MLGVDDPLPRTPRRVLVAGTSGAGKSTVAARIGGILGLPYTELDSLFHGPGWVPRESFQADVDRFSAEPEWACEWQYGPVRSMLADRADLLVWLDPPKRTVMRQVIARTLRRRIRREQLWNGNTEGPLYTFFTDPEHIVRWAWDQHHLTAEKVREADRRHPNLTVVRLRNRGEVEQWCARLARYQPDGL